MEKTLTRREEIYREAATLFFKKGYHATGMRELAKAVGIEQAVLYHYYSSKGEILYSIMKTAMQDLMESVDRAMQAAGNPAEKLVMFLTAHMSHFLKRREEVGMSHIEFRNLQPEQQTELKQMQTAYIEKFQALLKQAMEEGMVRPMDTKTTAMLLLAGTTSVASWYHPNGPLSSDELVAFFTDVLTKGLFQHQ